MKLGIIQDWTEDGFRYAASKGLQAVEYCVNGNYDPIDVAPLPDDDYEIVITSSYNNVFEGYFTM